jgi:mevalonate kinase
MAVETKRLTVSAPGKLFLLGEHAVVFEGKCLITAVDARLHMTLTLLRDTSSLLKILAPDVGLLDWMAPLETIINQSAFSGKGRFIESCVALFHRQYPSIVDLKTVSLSIETASDFSASLGLGSSSATVAACLYGLAKLFDVELSLDQLFDMGIAAIQQVQQLGSGADLAAAIYGGTLYYENRLPRRIIPLDLDNLPLLVIYSGEKAGTVSYVQQVGQLKARYPNLVDQIIATMLLIVEQGRECLVAQDWPRFGQLMNMQHGLLHALGVDTLSLAEIVFIARRVGAYGAKLSGAGGGDCAIILADEATRTAIISAVETAGKQILNLHMNAPGVQLD